MCDRKNVKSEGEVQYFVTLITNFKPVLTEGKGGQLNCDKLLTIARPYYC